MKPLQFWSCGVENNKRYCLQHHGCRPQIYNAQEAKTVGDVGKMIPRIYVALDNMKANHQASIIEMEGKLYDRVVSIFIDPRSNYSYISPHLVDKCCLNK